MAEAAGALLGRIRSTPPRELSPAEYAALARDVPVLDGALDPVRLVLLSTYTTRVLEPFLRVEAARHGFMLDVHHGGFGQLEQVLLGEEWRAPEGAVEVLVVAVRLEDLHPDLPHRFHADPAGFDRLAADVTERIEGLVSMFRRRSEGAALVANFAAPEPRPLGPFDANDPGSLTHRVADLNRRILQRLGPRSACHVWDYAGLVASAGAATWTDPRLWALARLPISAANQPLFAAHLCRTLRAVLRPQAKCLVVDLDGVLWGGAVGDDGIGGIVLGDEHPGLAHKNFQRAILGLRDRGVLLAICSKNDHEVACAAIDDHPEMLVTLDDFAAMRIDWSAKSDNLRRIAEELSIGLDSLVLFDDSPVERGEVALGAPQVEVVPVPPDPVGYVRALAETAAFDTPGLTDEDRTRAASYQAQRARDQADRRAGSLEEVLASLAMEASVGPLDALTSRRIAQLVGKTNQFNLTTRRQSQAELEAMAAAADQDVHWLRLMDRYGDMGLIAVAVLRSEGDDAVIHNLVLSCRAANRGVEQALVAHLAQLARERNRRGLVGEYIASDRNHVVADLYPRLGFTKQADAGPASRFRLDLERQNVTCPEYIDVRRLST